MFFFKPFFFIAVLIGLVVAFGNPRIRNNEASRDRVEDRAILGGITRHVQSADFRGGEATAFMGGIKLDLRDVETSREEVTLDLTAFMGGIEIIAPRDWDVQVRGAAILGGFEDHSFRPSGDHKTRLIVTGTAMLGGVTVR